MSKLSRKESLGWMNVVRGCCDSKLDYYLALRLAIEGRLIAPSAIIGTGFKNPRKSAFDYLDEQIKEHRHGAR